MRAKTNVPAHNANTKSLSKEEKRKQKIDLQGWLAFFTVSVGLSGLAYAASAILGSAAISNLSKTADTGAADLLGEYYGFLTLAAVISTGIAVWLLVLLAKWKKLAW